MGGRAPLVIVPTMYYATPTAKFREAGLSTVIWANHNLRASMTAMRDVCRRIRQDESLVEVEGRVVGVRDIFRLMGNHELEEAERRYLPARGAAKAIVLAASGGAIGPNPEALPKCMVDIRGQPLLRRMVTTLNESGIRDVTVVRGYRKEALTLPGIATIDNDAYATSGELGSLAVAQTHLEGDSVVLYGDVLFRRYILDDLLGMSADIAIAVDALWQDRRGRAPTRVRDLVAADRGAGDYIDDEPARLSAMGNDLPDSEVRGEWVGMVRFSAKGAALARAEIDAIRAEGTLAAYDLPKFLTRLAKVHPVAVHYVAGHWLDVDDISDLAAARNFL